MSDYVSITTNRKAIAAELVNILPSAKIFRRRVLTDSNVLEWAGYFRHDYQGKEIIHGWMVYHTATRITGIGTREHTFEAVGYHENTFPGTGAENTQDVWEGYLETLLDRFTDRMTLGIGVGLAENGLIIGFNRLLKTGNETLLTAGLQFKYLTTC